jgi:hypothetical protein
VLVIRRDGVNQHIERKNAPGSVPDGELCTCAPTGCMEGLMSERIWHTFGFDGVQKLSGQIPNPGDINNLILIDRYN